MFSVEELPLHYSKKKGFYYSNLRLQTLSHLPVVDQAVHIGGMGWFSNISWTKNATSVHGQFTLFIRGPVTYAENFQECGLKP